MKTNNFSVFAERQLPTSELKELIKPLANKQWKHRLPDDNNDKVQYIPAITQIRTRMKDKTESHYFKESFETKYSNEVIFRDILQLRKKRKKKEELGKNLQCSKSIGKQNTEIKGKHPNFQSLTSLTDKSVRSFFGSGVLKANTMQLAPIASKIKYSNNVRQVKDH